MGKIAARAALRCPSEIDSFGRTKGSLGARTRRTRRAVVLLHIANRSELLWIPPLVQRAKTEAYAKAAGFELVELLSGVVSLCLKVTRTVADVLALAGPEAPRMPSGAAR